MKLRMALEDKEMDLRLRDRLVAEGKISSASVDTYLKSLDDEEGNYVQLGAEKETTPAETTEQ
jgi:hypothetical protein